MEYKDEDESKVNHENSENLDEIYAHVYELVHKILADDDDSYFAIKEFKKTVKQYNLPPLPFNETLVPLIQYLMDNVSLAPDYQYKEKLIYLINYLSQTPGVLAEAPEDAVSSYIEFYFSYNANLEQAFKFLDSYILETKNKSILLKYTDTFIDIIKKRRYDAEMVYPSAFYICSISQIDFSQEFQQKILLAISDTILNIQPIYRSYYNALIESIKGEFHLEMLLSYANQPNSDNFVNIFTITNPSDARISFNPKLFLTLNKRSQEFMKFINYDFYFHYLTEVMTNFQEKQDEFMSLMALLVDFYKDTPNSQNSFILLDIIMRVTSDFTQHNKAGIVDFILDLVISLSENKSLTDEMFKPVIDRISDDIQTADEYIEHYTNKLLRFVDINRTNIEWMNYIREAEFIDYIYDELDLQSETLNLLRQFLEEGEE